MGFKLLLMWYDANIYVGVYDKIDVTTAIPTFHNFLSSLHHRAAVCTCMFFFLFFFFFETDHEGKE